MRRIASQVCASEVTLLTGGCSPIRQGDSFTLKVPPAARTSLFSYITILKIYYTKLIMPNTQFLYTLLFKRKVSREIYFT